MTDDPLLTPPDNPIMQLLKAEMLRRGYRVQVSEDGLEERVIRPDGTVAIIARKKPEQ